MTAEDPATSANVLGQRIKEQREAKGWTQAELARRARVERSTVQNIEAGRVKRPSTLPHIMKALGMDEGELNDDPVLTELLEARRLLIEAIRMDEPEAMRELLADALAVIGRVAQAERQQDAG